MSAKIAAYAESLGLPTTQAGQIKALAIAGVPREAILSSLEHDSRIPAFCDGPIQAAYEASAEPTAPAIVVDANISFGPPQADAQVVYFDSLPNNNGSAIIRAEYQLYDSSDVAIGSPVVLVNTIPLTNGTAYYINSLTPETTYHVTFRVVNAEGNGPWSLPFVFTTDVAA